MRSTLGVTVLVLMTAQAVAAQTASTSRPTPATDPTGAAALLVRAGYFTGSSEFKDIYGNGPVYGGEVRIPLPPADRRIVLWAEGAYRTRKGQTSFTKESTTARVFTFESGVLYRLVRGRVSPYLGGGVGYHSLNERSDALGTAEDAGVGFLGTGGVTIALTSRFALDLRAKYSTCTVEPSPRSPDATFKVNVGGLTGGIGIGFFF